LAGIALAFVLFLSSGFIISLYLSGSSFEKQAAARLIFNIFLLTLPFSAANSVLISFLQNGLNFFKPAIARLSTNVAVIIIVLLLSRSFGTVIIPIGYFAGELIQFIILSFRIDIKLFTLKKSLIIKKDLKNSLSFNFLLIIVIEALSQLYTISDRYFIKSVQEGGIAALNYAQTIFVLPITTISVALSTAIFPKLSQDYSSGSFGQLEKKFYSGLRINILLFIPIMFVFFFNGEELIKLVFQRGKFGQEDTIITAAALKYFSISLVFYSIYSILNKMIYSTRLIKSLLILTVIGISIKISLNYMLVGTLAQNGLALSSSLSYIFFFFAGFIILNKKLPFLNASLILRESILHLTCASISYFIAVFLFGMQSWGGNSFIILLAFIVIYFLNFWLLKTDSFKLILNLIPSIRERMG
jgi:putative peptidoglycan lipid II flippase